MSEMAKRFSVDAAAYMQMQHELRQYREAEQFPNVIPEFHLRKGTITARDPASYTVSVMFSAADTSDFPGVSIPGIRLASTVYPKIGAQCFVAFNGPEPTVLFTVNSPVGSVRAWHTASQSINENITTALLFNTDLGSGMHDTDLMHTSGEQEVYCRWPGHYSALGRVQFDTAVTTGVRRIVSVEITRAAGGSAFVARTEDRYAVTNSLHVMEAVALDFKMAADDYIRVHVFQGGTGALNSISLGEFAPLVELTWRGPP